jgi:hypothetical protein
MQVAQGSAMGGGGIDEGLTISERAVQNDQIERIHPVLNNSVVGPGYADHVHDDGQRQWSGEFGDKVNPIPAH